MTFNQVNLNQGDVVNVVTGKAELPKLVAFAGVAGAGKDAAAKAFAKRKFDPTALAAVLAAVEAQRGSPSWAKDGGQFVPHPATWLNEGRWQDEVAGGGASTPWENAR